MKRDDWTEEFAQQLADEINRNELVCGVDEVGRGPIAGPVVACAIIMPKDHKIPGIKDSKKISEKKRDQLYELILENAVGWGIGMVDERVIDEINIRQATLLAMKNALNSISDRTGQPIRPDLVLVDAERIDTDIAQRSIIKGDDRIYAISCASIIAKVTRDRLMIDYSREYPGYGFEKHKGYGTAAHYEALRHRGVLPIHRRSFLHGKDLYDNPEHRGVDHPPV